MRTARDLLSLDWGIEMMNFKNGRKIRMGIEENVVITENGVEWLSPVVERILLIRAPNEKILLIR